MKSVEAGWQLSSSWRGGQNNPAEQVKKEKSARLSAAHVLPLQDLISSFRSSPTEVNNWMFCLARHWCWMPVTWLNKRLRRTRDCIGKVYFISRRGVDWAEQSIQQQQRHLLVIRTGWLTWWGSVSCTDTPISLMRTRTFTFEWGFLLPKASTGCTVVWLLMVLRWF